ncbi:MAG: FmdB family zinc ribbon protein [Rubrobacteraceae bacterium]
MPIYEYKCENGHVFDVMRKISDEPLRECVECGAPVKKVLHPVGISFKGSGFYSTDYSKGGKKTEPSTKNGATETKTEKGADSGTEKKSESSSKEPAKKQG